MANPERVRHPRMFGRVRDVATQEGTDVIEKGAAFLSQRLRYIRYGSATEQRAQAINVAAVCDPISCVVACTWPRLGPHDLGALRSSEADERSIKILRLPLTWVVTICRSPGSSLSGHK
jgi:hypothetical protein